MNADTCRLIVLTQMRFVLGFCLILLISVSEVSSLELDHLSAAKNRPVTGLVIETKDILRQKRSSGSLGEAAVSYLLKGAQHLYSSTLARVFVKHGGYIRALEDFKTIQPSNTKVVRIKGEVIREGRAGDRTVFLGRGGVSYDDFPAIVVTKQSPSGPQRRPVYIIYK